MNMHDEHIKSIFHGPLPNVDLVKRLLNANSQKGAGGWLDCPTQRMYSVAYAAAWRLRCFAKALSLPSGAACPTHTSLGVMDQREFALHAHGCASMPSKKNATNAHNHLARHLDKVCRNNAIRSEVEPRGFQTYTCTKCGVVIEGQHVLEKLKQHDRSCGARPLRSGVDLEVMLGSDRYMLDFTVIHSICPSLAKSSFDALAQMKIREKTARYVGTGMIPPKEFVVAIVWSHGALHKDFVDFLKKLASEAHVDFSELVAGVRNCAVWGQGAAISAAFKTVCAASYSRAIL